MSLVSIVVPSYNCENYIVETLDSLVNQTYQNLQIVFVDDGSTDSTPDLIKRYKEHDSRIELIEIPNSGTPSVPRNLGIRSCKGEYICFNDADDIFALDKVERQVSILAKHKNIDMLFSELAIFENSVKEVTNTFLSSRDFKARADSYLRKIEGNLYECAKNFYIFMATDISSVSTQTLFVRASRLMSMDKWFPEDMRIGEDVDLFFRLARLGNMAYLDEVTAFYRQRSSSLTNDSTAAMEGFINISELNYNRVKHELTSKLNEKCLIRLAESERQLAYAYATRKEYDKSLGLLKRSLRRRVLPKNVISLIKTYIKKFLY